MLIAAGRFGLESNNEEPSRGNRDIVFLIVRPERRACSASGSFEIQESRLHIVNRRFSLHQRKKIRYIRQMREMRIWQNFALNFSLKH